MRLLLIRHGQTPSNVTRTLDTALPGPGLTDLGLQQAAGIPGTVADEQIEAVYVTRARRTHLTAQPLTDHLGLTPIELPGAHEVQAGEVEQRSDDEAVLAYVGPLAQWVAGDLDAAIPGGENGHDFLTRFDDSVGRIADAGHSTAALVSHGAAIRTWVAARSGNLGPGFVRNNHLPNTGVVVLEGEPGAWVTRSWLGVPLGGPGIDDGGLVEDALAENAQS